MTSVYLLQADIRGAVFLGPGKCEPPRAHQLGRSLSGPILQAAHSCGHSNKHMLSKTLRSVDIQRHG